MNTFDFQTGQTLSAHEAIKRGSLKSSGGGGMFDDMDTVDAKIAAAEARTDTKFAKLLSQLELLNLRMGHVETSTAGLKLNTWLAMASAVALVVAIFGWGSSMFGVGMNVESVANKAASSTAQTAQPQIDALSARYTEMNGKLDQLIEAIAISQGKPGTSVGPEVNVPRTK